MDLLYSMLFNETTTNRNNWSVSFAQIVVQLVVQQIYNKSK